MSDAKMCEHCGKPMTGCYEFVNYNGKVGRLHSECIDACQNAAPPPTAADRLATLERENAALKEQNATLRQESANLEQQFCARNKARRQRITQLESALRGVIKVAREHGWHNALTGRKTILDVAELALGNSGKSHE